MNNQPTEQQLKDPQWWDENAPEGATHFWEHKKIWYMVKEGCVYIYTDNWMLSSVIIQDIYFFNKRPTKATLNNWDDRHPKAHDEVNHPSHYQLGGGLESIDVIRATLTAEQFKGFCLGNTLKYRLRAGNKGDAQRDIDKAEWYKKEIDK